jgi:hypothetical protein
MGWNHRIIKDKCKITNEDYYSIHEVYYDKDTGLPNASTQDPINISTEDIKGMAWTINKLKECLDKPVLQWNEEKRIYIELDEKYEL